LRELAPDPREEWRHLLYSVRWSTDCTRLPSVDLRRVEQVNQTSLNLLAGSLDFVIHVSNLPLLALDLSTLVADWRTCGGDKMPAEFEAIVAASR
jgi:hypothetical protein